MKFAYIAEGNESQGSDDSDSDSDISSIVGMLLTDEQLARMRDMRQVRNILSLNEKFTFMDRMRPRIPGRDMEIRENQG